MSDDPCPDRAERLVDCPACDTSGSVDGHPCPVCDGTGAAWPEEVTSWLENQDADMHDDWAREERNGLT